MKKKLGVIVLSAVLAMSALTGCGASEEGGATTGGTISVVSREDGSGTRGAFIELFGIEEKDSEGNKVDHTTEDATIANKTDVMLTNVAGDENAIGYISLGSMNDSVKAVKIDGAEATVDNINKDTYKIARPFNIATKSNLSKAAQDFMNFILSKEGQQIVEDNHYIKVDESAAAFSGGNVSGKVVVAGSSSVSPVMEKLKEAYEKINKNVTVEVNTSDSTTGMQSAMEGTCDIGMASRELKDTEKETLTGTVIAIDGIAVIVNNDNDVEELTSEQVKSIFTGETTSWDDVK